MAGKKKIINARAIELAKTPVHARAQEIVRSVLNPKIQREAYDHEMNVSRFLETLDPSKDHAGTPLEGTDAFNRVLAAAGHRTRSVHELGLEASTLEDVVSHPTTRFLALELFARAYRSVIHGSRGSWAKDRAPILSTLGLAGSLVNAYTYPAPRDVLLQPQLPLSELVGVTTGIRTNYYRPFYLEDVSNANSRVAESAEVPAVKIATSEKTISLVKYGRRIDVTYEALRHIAIDLLAFNVQRIAIAVEAEKVDKVLDVIVNGDGNANSSATNYNLTALDPATTANNLTLKAWLAFKMKFLNPLKLTTVLAQDVSALTLMLLNIGSANLPAYLAGSLVGAQGVTPINNELGGGERVGWVASAPSGKLVGFDKRLSIERVFEIGSNIQEQDTDVVSQINKLVLTEVEGYAIIDYKANKTLTLTA